MAIYTDRESFIPYRRADLVELCIEDGKLPAANITQFRQFCEILAAYYHFKLHHALENLKDNFAPFDPDTDTKPRLIPGEKQLQHMHGQLTQQLSGVLEQANYERLSEADLKMAFEQASLIPLNTNVDFDDFEEMLIYYRGAHPITITMKQFFIRKVERTFDVFERVVLLLKFKDEAYFKAKKVKLEKLPFTPGKIYLSLYKSIPKFDLELLFPNVQVSMTMKDRLMLGVPAIGAAIPILLKVVPSLGLLIGLIMLLVWGQSAITSWLHVTDEQVNNFYPILTATLTAVIALGGFGFKQYTNYKNKRIQSLKEVTDTLFFRNLDNNSGVFHRVIDSAEEETTKEMILAYYHLLTHPQPMTQSELDDFIEAWLEKKFDTKIDFDVAKSLQNLTTLQGQYIDTQTQISQVSSLVTQDKNHYCHALPLAEAKTVIDYAWDNLFQYNV